MQQFEKKFESHKIPEYYRQYFDYSLIKQTISEFKDKLKNDTI